MANDGKFLNLTGGKPSQEQAIAVSAGAADASKIIRLDGGGKIDQTFLPSGIGPESRLMVASEGLSAGDLVNFHNNAGTINMRKADADVVGREAHGFVLTAVLAAASGTVFPEQAVIGGLAGMVPGATQFLSIVAGARTEVCPSGAAVIAQIVGVALSATEMMFSPQAAIAQV